MTQQENISPPPHRISKVAVLFALFTVLGAVVFGVYGPKIAARLTLLGGITLDEVLHAAAYLRAGAIMELQSNTPELSLIPEQQNATLTRLLGRSCRLPQFEKAGYQLQRVSAVSLPGASFRSVELVYQSVDDTDKKWLVLYMAADDGQFLSFDELGRSHQFVPDNLILESIERNDEDASLIMIWSDGPVLYLACIEDQDEIEKLLPYLGSTYIEPSLQP